MMLEVQGVYAGYGPVTVLREVSLGVEEGEIVAVIGPNGAGKSTLMRTLTGLIRVSRGRVDFQGEEIHRLPPHAIVSKGIAHVMEGRGLFAPLTVEENLRLGASVARRRDSKEADGKDQYQFVYDLFPRLYERRQQAAGTLSGGEQQMLAVGRALMAKPRLLLLDEPSAGLGPMVVEKLYEVLQNLNRGGLSILVVEQNARVALEIAHRAYVLTTGRVTMSGPTKDLIADRRVQALYLGESVE